MPLTPHTHRQTHRQTHGQARSGLTLCLASFGLSFSIRTISMYLQELLTRIQSLLMPSNYREAEVTGQMG